MTSGTSSRPISLQFISMTLLTAVVVAVFLGMIQDFLIALFLAAVLSGILFPTYKLIKDRMMGGRPGVAAAVTLTLLFLGGIVPLMALIFLLAEQARDIGQSAIPWIREQLANDDGMAANLPQWLPFREQIQALLPDFLVRLGELSGSISQVTFQLASRVTSSIAAFLLGLLVFFYGLYYFLTKGGLVLERAKAYAHVFGGIHEQVLERALAVSQATIRGTLLIGLIQGTLAGIGFAIFGVQGAVFWGGVMAVASFIPIVGPAIVWIPAVFYLLAINEPLQAIGLAAWSLIIVSNIDNILRPYLVGRESKLSDLVVLISTLGGLSMFGAAGLIIGPVIAAVCITIVDAYGQILQKHVSGEEQAGSGI